MLHTLPLSVSAAAKESLEFITRAGCQNIWEVRKRLVRIGLATGMRIYYYRQEGWLCQKQRILGRWVLGLQRLKANPPPTVSSLHQGPVMLGAFESVWTAPALHF